MSWGDLYISQVTLHIQLLINAYNLMAIKNLSTWSFNR